MKRYALIGAALAIAAFALLHAAPKAPAPIAVAPAAAAPRRIARSQPSPAGDAVVYVAGAVRAPGLYRLESGGRAAEAVQRAGGFAPGADRAGVNLAARVADGEEIEVPLLGQPARSARRDRAPLKRRPAAQPPEASVDVNGAAAQDLARVPGIGRALAQRIVELRERDGAFASLDELLDVAGMTSARLERARPFLRQP